MLSKLDLNLFVSLRLESQPNITIVHRVRIGCKQYPTLAILEFDKYCTNANFQDLKRIPCTTESKCLRWHNRCRLAFLAGVKLSTRGAERQVYIQSPLRAITKCSSQTKRDLGFIEGDLIECLNAGDGSWWMGRLKRDRRMVGLFPSNFVQVLEDYQPTPISRNPSPLPIRNGSGPSRGGSNASQNNQPTPKSKSVFRKPFQAYNEVGPKGAVAQLDSPAKNGSISKHRPYSSMKKAQTPGNNRAVSPSPPKQDTGYVLQPVPRGSQSSISRAPSPAPPHSRAPSPSPVGQYRAASPAPSQFRAYSPNPYADPRAPSPAPSHFRATSPAPPVHNGYSRAVSPAPSFHDPNDLHLPRSISPAPFGNGASSPPPPAPPPHRSTFNSAPNQYNVSNGQEPFNRQTRTPVPASPARHGHTPSPLRDAMNDVMSSLQGMSFDRRSPHPQEESSAPPNVWSPEAFDEVYNASARNARAQTSQGFDYEDPHNMPDDDGGEEDYSDQRYFSGGEGPPQVHDYVERMENRLRQMHQAQESASAVGPTPPLKDNVFKRPQSIHVSSDPLTSQNNPQIRPGSTTSGSRRLKNRKSAYELGRSALNRTFTGKSSATTSSTGKSTTTNSSQSTQMTSQSLMSGYSASGFSATSAGSLARRKFGIGGSIRERPKSSLESRINAFEGRGAESGNRPITPFSGVTFHSSHDSNHNQATNGFSVTNDLQTGVSDLGGLAAPKAKKSGFFKKMLDSARTGAASARSTIGSRPNSTSPEKRSMLGFGSSSRPGTASGRRSVAADMGLSGIGGDDRGAVTGGRAESGAATAMGLGGDWMQVRRDVNRSNSLSNNERQERAERCAMLDQPVLAPVDVLLQTAEGDEGLDGLPVGYPTDFDNANVKKNLELVDKSARFVNSLPPTTNAAGLAQGYVCRPYRSDVQRLRAIFTWVAEKVGWEEDFEFSAPENGGDVLDTRRVIHARRGCSEEIATLVSEMCTAMGIHCEIVHGYLKQLGEALELAMEGFNGAASSGRGNHFWNAVIVDGEYRILDASLSGPTHPRRSEFSSVAGHAAESWYFLARPMEACYTHVPLVPEQQHIVSPISPEILLALPCACPPFFRNGLQMQDFDTSLLSLENLELVQVAIAVDEMTELVAEVEARGFVKDADGEFFVESGQTLKKRALAQPEWKAGRKRFVVKGAVPGEGSEAVLKIYAGKKGLMVSFQFILRFFEILAVFLQILDFWMVDGRTIKYAETTNINDPALHQIQSISPSLSTPHLPHRPESPLRFRPPSSHSTRSTARPLHRSTAMRPSRRQQHLRLRRPTTSSLPPHLLNFQQQ